MPSSLDTQEALVQYVTMVIFTCSAKHAAVSAGQVRKGQVCKHRNGRARVSFSLYPLCLQFDACVWMPNLPPTMQLPPPTSKGQVRPEGFIATLPPVNATCDVIIALWMLSKEPGDRVSMELGVRLDRKVHVVYPPWTKLNPDIKIPTSKPPPTTH